VARDKKLMLPFRLYLMVISSFVTYMFCAIPLHWNNLYDENQVALQRVKCLHNPSFVLHRAFIQSNFVCCKYWIILPNRTEENLNQSKEKTLEGGCE